MEDIFKGPCIDHYFFRGSENQSFEVLGQYAHHGPLGISTSDKAQSSTASLMDMNQNPVQPQQAVEMNLEKSLKFWGLNTATKKE